MTNYDNNNPNANQVAQTIPTYKRLAKQQWPAIDYQQLIKPGKHSPQIPAIRHRLAALGDLKGTENNSINLNSSLYNRQLRQAVKVFQRRHGLNPDGVIGESTIAALNVTPKTRLVQLQQSVQEWTKLPQKSEQAYMQVNIPSYELNVIENNETKLTMKVVVGSKKWPTPTLNSQIKSIVINPKWTVPRNIVEKEIVHKMVKNPDYLAENNIQIYKGWQRNTEIVDASTIDWHQYTGRRDLPFRLQQTPGDHNALGRIKFTFPNDEHIYLHDTPHKFAFSLPQRNLSHGCIRLENPYALLEYFLNNEQINNTKKLGSFIAGEKTKHFSLNKPLPLYITNISSWVDTNGILHFSSPKT